MKLKPCPFCWSSRIDRSVHLHYLECMNCGATGPEPDDAGPSTDPRAAITLWNRRPPADATQMAEQTEAALMRAGHQIQVLQAERQHLAEKIERMAHRLGAIVAALPPDLVKGPNGQLFEFVPPDPLMYWKELGAAIKAAIASAEYQEGCREVVMMNERFRNKPNTDVV